MLLSYCAFTSANTSSTVCVTLENIDEIEGQEAMIKVMKVRLSLRNTHAQTHKKGRGAGHKERVTSSKKMELQRLAQCLHFEAKRARGDQNV